MSDPRASTDTLRQQLDQSLGTAYRIERELGGGGMAHVFLAEEVALNRRVVVKVLSRDLAHELSAERFAREIKLAARLQHPNIVPLLTAGSAGDAPYYTMPFIDGDSLRQRLQRISGGDQLPLSRALDILRDIARALAYAHTLGVVHRDIKPENVLLGYDAAVVADFGVAKALEAARTHHATSQSITLTQGGMALGTPAYMSPEQAAGDPDVDHRADLYAWGVVAYELLAGQHPFADKRSVQAVVAAHLVERPRELAEVAPHLPPPIAGVVMRCLAKNRDERPARASEIVDALGSGAIPALAAAVSKPAAQPASKRRPATIAAIALGIGLLGAIGAIAYELRDRTTAREPIAHANPASSPGYDAYMRGKVRVGNENRQDNEAAIAALREAIQVDPSLAPAHAALARALAVRLFYFAPADSEKKRLSEDAEVEVEKALALDPRSGDAYFARGLLLWTPNERFPHDQAVRAYRRALELDPTLDEAHHQIALVYLHVGLLDEAVAEVDKALAINPANTLARFRYGVIDLYRGDYEGAYKIFKSTSLERNPSLWGFQMSTALFRLGREREASELVDQYLRDFPKDEGGVGNSVRAMMLAKAGRRADAEASIKRALELGRSFGHFHHAAYNIATAYALLGEHKQAIDWLENAADGGFPCYPLFANDELLASLRNEPRFVALLARLKADLEQRKRTLLP